MPRVLLSQPLAVKDELCWSFLIDVTVVRRPVQRQRAAEQIHHNMAVGAAVITAATIDAHAPVPHASVSPAPRSHTRIRR